MPDETTILNFCHLIERNQFSARLLAEVNAMLGEQGSLLRRGAMADATIIDAPGPTKFRTGTPDPMMRQTKKGKHWRLKGLILKNSAPK